MSVTDPRLVPECLLFCYASVVGTPFLCFGTHMCIIVRGICPTSMIFIYYEVLDYGLIWKNNPKWGLVSVASAPGVHLIHLICRFTCHSDIFIKYGALGSFLCQVMCSAQYLSSFALSSLELSLYAMLKVDPRNKVGVIIHAIWKNALGNHIAKNAYGDVNYAKWFIQGTVVTVFDGRTQGEKNEQHNNQHDNQHDN